MERSRLPENRVVDVSPREIGTCVHQRQPCRICAPLPKLPCACRQEKDSTPMTPRELIDTAPVPGGQELRLYRRGGDHMIVLDRNELMSSRMSGSEKALAILTLDRLKGTRNPHLLIGGYGMGF